jgi:hypothetical protein
MSDIERELVKAARLRKQEDTYKHRQDYLADLVRHFDKICAKDDDAVDSVSEEAYTWYEEAATAINGKDIIPDFPDIALVEIEPEPEIEEPEDEPGYGDDVPEDEPEPEAAPKKVKAKPKAKAKPKGKSKRELHAEKNEEGLKDKYGTVIGTIRHGVLKLFERGATQAECKKEFGQTYYNLLKHMQLLGHLVERTGPGVFKLTHKDEVK